MPQRSPTVDRRGFLVAAAGLAVAPRALAAGPRRVALVTAELESHVVAVDLASGRILRRIETAPDPRSVEAVGPAAVVGHFTAGAVTLIDAATLRVAHVLHGFGAPRYVAGHPDGRHAYVSDARLGQVVALDVRRGRTLGRADVGAEARHVSVDPAGRTLWVSLGSKAAEVAVVDLTDPARPTLRRRFRPPFLAHDVGFAPDGRHVWVSSGDRDELAVYDARDGRLLARPSGDWPPQHVTFHGGLAYVTSGWSGTLRVHRAAGAPLSTTVVPVGSYNVQQAGGRVLTPGLGTGTLVVLDDAARILRSERVARSTHDCCVVSA